MSCRSRDSLARRRPGRCEKDRSIRLRGDEALPLQPLDGAIRGHVGDTQSPREVRQARLARLRNQLGNHFHVVLRKLLRAILSARSA